VVLGALAGSWAVDAGPKGVEATMRFYVEPYFPSWGHEQFIVVAAKEGPVRPLVGPMDDEEEAEMWCLALNVMAGARALSSAARR